VTDQIPNDDAAPDSEGRPLRDVRAERLLSIRELAQMAGVAPSTIYMIEAGRSLPQLSVARRIAEALQVDAMTILELRRTIRAHGRPR
jgi:DNA-binding XRE family transcriptional regulator